MRLEIAAAAEQELDEAVAWYRLQQPGLQPHFLNEFRSALQRINMQPTLYAEIHPGIRRGLFHRFPYSIIYEIKDQTLRILAIAHQHRKPLYWTEESR